MYGLSVLLKNPDDGHGERSYMVHHLPWLIGSLGTLTLDLVVSFQTREEMASSVPLTCYILADAELVETAPETACVWVGTQYVVSNCQTLLGNEVLSNISYSAKLTLLIASVSILSVNSAK